MSRLGASSVKCWRIVACLCNLDVWPRLGAGYRVELHGLVWGIKSIVSVACPFQAALQTMFIYNIQIVLHNNI